MKSCYDSATAFIIKAFEITFGITWMKLLLLINLSDEIWKTSDKFLRVDPPLSLVGMDFWVLTQHRYNFHMKVVAVAEHPCRVGVVEENFNA